jgi:hypothetical protein
MPRDPRAATSISTPHSSEKRIGLPCDPRAATSASACSSSCRHELRVAVSIPLRIIIEDTRCSAILGDCKSSILGVAVQGISWGGRGPATRAAAAACQRNRERMPGKASDRGGDGRGTPFCRKVAHSVSGDFDMLLDHGGARGGRNKKEERAVCRIRVSVPQTFHSFWETTVEVWNPQTSPFSPCHLFAWSERQVVMQSLAAAWHKATEEAVGCVSESCP